ncbi:MAG TPA: hypothetical protein VL094_04555 [Sphingomonadaceae bacterium]|nr:hypothetical protein [Sphingomonadaceae bacterium]
MTERQCRDLLGAAQKALEIERPFNRWITVLWERGGLANHGGTRATGAFLKLYGDWMRSYGEKACWVYTHEHGEENGIHLHLLLHIPVRLDAKFRVMPRRWTAGILPNGYVKQAVKSLKLTGGNSPDPYLRDLYLLRLRAKLHYMLKAASKHVEASLGLSDWGEAEWGQVSLVYGKRSGCWQNWRRAGSPSMFRVADGSPLRGVASQTLEIGP